jgi:NAD(P)-dependent dehydrogenase (short-subunit alcohol dehydrogenase family)
LAGRVVAEDFSGNLTQRETDLSFNNRTALISGAAKAGAAHPMRHLAREVGPFGVTANLISLCQMDNVPKEFSAPLIKMIPTRRLGTSDDVAAAVSYLAGEEASWITGQTLAVNGGALAI